MSWAASLLVPLFLIATEPVVSGWWYGVGECPSRTALNLAAATGTMGRES